MLVETGSALGFTFMAMAGRSALPSVSPSSIEPAVIEPQLEPEPEPAEPEQPVRTILRKMTSGDAVTRWTLARLDIVSKGRIQGSVAYEDFRGWCADEGFELITPRMFGRRLRELITSMGGRKVRIGGLNYYEGVVLQAQAMREMVEQRLAA